MLYLLLGCPIQDGHLRTGVGSAQATKITGAGALALSAESLSPFSLQKKIPAGDPAASTLPEDVLKKRVRLSTAELRERMSDNRHKEES